MQPDTRFDFQLEADLAAAGVAARATADQAPDLSFGSGLRSQLLTEYAAHAAVARRQPRRRGWLARFAPVFATMLAATMATVVVAGAFRLLVPPPTGPVAPPSVAPPSPYVIDPSLIGGGTWTPTPSPTQTPTPTATPTASPTPTPSPMPTPSPEPTPVPTPKPTLPPTPQPSPTPPPVGQMTIGLTGCNGGVVIGWSGTQDPRFAKYRTLRSTSPAIPVAFPPQAGAIDVVHAKSATMEARSGYDPTAAPGTTFHYRTLALDAGGAVIATTGVAPAAAQPVAGLGTLVVAPDAGGTRFTWTPFAGSAACFSYYKLVYTLDGSPPSYIEGDPHLLALANQAQSTAVSPGLVSGTTYTLRLQAIRATDTGAFVVAQTDVATYTAP